MQTYFMNSRRPWLNIAKYCNITLVVPDARANLDRFDGHVWIVTVSVYHLIPTRAKKFYPLLHGWIAKQKGCLEINLHSCSPKNDKDSIATPATGHISLQWCILRQFKTLKGRKS